MPSQRTATVRSVPRSPKGGASGRAAPRYLPRLRPPGPGPCRTWGRIPARCARFRDASGRCTPPRVRARGWAQPRTSPGPPGTWTRNACCRRNTSCRGNQHCLRLSQGRQSCRKPDRSPSLFAPRDETDADIEWIANPQTAVESSERLDAEFRLADAETRDHHEHVVLPQHGRGEAQIARHSTERDACRDRRTPDRKSTRLNSSHDQISYAVFCLKKKKIVKSADSLRCTSLL